MVETDAAQRGWGCVEVAIQRHLPVAKQTGNWTDLTDSPVSLLPSAAAADAPVVVEEDLPAADEQREVPVLSG